MKTIIVIANSEWALFAELENHQIKIIDEREHPQSKDKIEHLVSDRPGRTFSRMSAVRHSLNEGQDVADAEREKFAREVVKRVQEEQPLSSFDQLWVVAGPKFLGELRPLLHKHLAFPIREFAKEVPPHESIEEKLSKVLEWARGDAPKKRSPLKIKHLNKKEFYHETSSKK